MRNFLSSYAGKAISQTQKHFRNNKVANKIFTKHNRNERREKNVSRIKDNKTSKQPTSRHIIIT